MRSAEWIPVALLAVLTAGGCAQETQPTAKQVPPVSTTPPAARNAPPVSLARGTVVPLGSSVRGAPIEMRVFGNGQVPILILGGIHGDEPTSVDLTTNLIALLESDPSIVFGKRVAIIRVANPDGLAKGTRTNANRVDLNRNFPASNYKSTRAVLARAGKGAASEPETRAILAALEQVQPRLIISIHSITKGRQCNNYDGPGEEIATLMSRFNRYPVTPTIGYPTPGSMGSYCGKDLGIAMITLELPNGQPGETAWKTNKDALVAAIRAAH